MNKPITGPRKQATPANLRECLLMSASRSRGMSMLHLSMARNAKGDLRKIYVKAAREEHHIYLARLREAQAATWGQPIGYYMPPEIPATPSTMDTARVPVMRMAARQAS